MKTIFLVLLIFSLPLATFAKEAKVAGTIKLSRIKKVAKSKNPFTRVMCSQKSIPLKVEQSLNAQLLTVVFTAEKKIDNFSLKNVRGIDGINVSKFFELMNQKLESGERIESSVELEDFKGLAYVVFDVSITINGLSTDYSIPVAVGELSASQRSERSKNIKEIKVKSQQKDGANSMTAPPKKIHEMQLE